MSQVRRATLSGVAIAATNYGEDFSMKTLIRFMVLVAVVLFCWGWISNVALGRMTTGQYVRSIGMDFQQGIKNSIEKILNTKKAIAYNLREWRDPIVV